MTTPTTPRQAREAAELYRDTGTTVSVTRVFSLADQIEKLTKERDEQKVKAEALISMFIELKSGCYEEDMSQGLADQVEALTIANKDLINWHEALKADYENLKTDANKWREFQAALDRGEDRS